jgi:metallo-beta-lactamase class B
MHAIFFMITRCDAPGRLGGPVAESGWSVYQDWRLGRALTLYLTPGHTEGTISTIFPVRDGGRQYTAAAWGGTLFNFGPIRERLVTYGRSADRFRGIAAKAGAEVILSNHTIYDGSRVKLPAMATRRPGQAHPYVVGADVVARYLTVVGECAQAATAGLPPR